MVRDGDPLGGGWDELLREMFQQSQSTVVSRPPRKVASEGARSVVRTREVCFNVQPRRQLRSAVTALAPLSSGSGQADSLKLIAAKVRSLDLKIRQLQQLYLELRDRKEQEPPTVVVRCPTPPPPPPQPAPPPQLPPQIFITPPPPPPQPPAFHMPMPHQVEESAVQTTETVEPPRPVYDRPREVYERSPAPTPARSPERTETPRRPHREGYSAGVYDVPVRPRTDRTTLRERVRSEHRQESSHIPSSGSSPDPGRRDENRDVYIRRDMRGAYYMMDGDGRPVRQPQACSTSSCSGYSTNVAKKLLSRSKRRRAHTSTSIDRRTNRANPAEHRRRRPVCFPSSDSLIHPHKEQSSNTE